MIRLTIPLAAVVLAACPAVEPGDGTPAEGEGEDEGEGEPFTESEPNSGNPLTDVDVLPPDTTITGAIATADDVDVFHLIEAPAGRAFSARVTGIASAHVTVIDDGRSGEDPGNDYVRISDGPTIDFMTLGGSVYVVVTADVAGDYRLVVDDITDDVTAAALTSTPLTTSLATPESIMLLPFAGSEGDDVVFDLAAAGFDARLFVVAGGDWIARNDDRATDDVDPLIDAPLTAAGPYQLLIECTEPNSAGALDFTLSSTLP